MGNLEDQIDDSMLFVMFSKFGGVIQLKIVRDFETRRSKCFAFVSYGT